MKKLSLVFGLLAMVCACKNANDVKPETPVAPNPLDALPKDTGGTHTAVQLGTDASPYGYYVYTPSAYTATGAKFPLLVFLHGSGEIGDSLQPPAGLDKILAHGPPKLIHDGTWAPKYPMIVASPQCYLGWWDVNRVRKFIEFVMAKYQVDSTRIYLTGLDMGGFGTFDQLTNYGEGAHIAAAISISGAGTVSPEMVQRASTVPFWAFHGANDTIVPPGFDILIHQQMAGLHPKVNPRLTLYDGVGHDAWTETYDGAGMGKGDPSEDPFNVDIYSWMLQYHKSATGITNIN